MVGSLSPLGFAIAGFLVGLGTKLGNGCTSGHGVCGIPRLSIRSTIAVVVFMGMGVLTATVKYYAVSEAIPENSHFNIDYDVASKVVLVLSLTGILITLIAQYVIDRTKIVDVIIGSISIISRIQSSSAYSSDSASWSRAWSSDPRLRPSSLSITTGIV
jgi:hypothetical protein